MSGSAAPKDENNPNGGPLSLLSVVPPPVDAAAAAIRPGGFWRRAVAAFIDGVLLGLAEQTIFWFIGISKAVNERPLDASLNVQLTPEQVRGHLLAFAIGALLNVTYCYLFYRWKAATVGKLAMGLKVVDVETGERLGFGQTILREFFGKTASFVVLGVGYLMVPFRKDKRALHDFVAGTQVRLR